MVDSNVRGTPVILLKDLAMLRTPHGLARLPVPLAVEDMEQKRVLHGHHGEQRCWREPVFEDVLSGEVVNQISVHGLGIHVARAHAAKVQHDQARVEPGEVAGSKAPC